MEEQEVEEQVVEASWISAAALAGATQAAVRELGGMTVKELTAQMHTMSHVMLDAVGAYEAVNKNRKTVLQLVEKLRRAEE